MSGINFNNCTRRAPKFVLAVAQEVSTAAKYPSQVAQKLKITKIEAELALWIAAEMGVVFKGRDGRYLWLGNQ